MPWISQSNLTRRHFLGTAAAAVTLRGAAAETRWAMLSDIHIPTDPARTDHGFNEVANFKVVVSQVLKYAPNGALITGDLAFNSGLPSDYQALQGLIAPLVEKIPVALALGNHDDRKNFLEAFGELLKDRCQAVVGKQILVIESSPVRLIILDSNTQIPYVAGLLGKAQRTWLDEYLSAADSTPTLLFFHHPPDDGDNNLHDSDRLMKIVAPHRQVKALVYGHSHAYRYSVEQDIHLVNLPTTAYTFSAREPLGWVEAKLTASGGEFTLRALLGNKEQDGRTVHLKWRA